MTLLAVELLDDRTAPAVLVTLAADAPPAVGLEMLGLGVYRAADGADLSHIRGLLAVEPEETLHITATPNDPSYPTQYALDAIQAPAAWDVTIGTGRTVVAVIDSGVDYTHTDLAANIWTNTGEVPANGRDDDGNGFVDDIHGYDFVGDDAEPRDEFGHGSHVAGIIAAVGDNGVGVAGVNWRATIMPVRFLDARGNGSTGDAVRALAYAVANGAKVSNHSWGGAVQSEALATAVERARAAGHVVVAAAGNDGGDRDRVASYPASLAPTADNVVSVAATDFRDRLAAFSGYGAAVTLAAPGDGILSTLPNGRYGTKTGTSMATAFVSGAVALLWDRHPDWSYSQVIGTLKDSVDVLPTLAGKTQTGGRLNVARLIGGAATDPPPADPNPPPTVPAPRGFVPTPVTPLPSVRKDVIAVSVVGQATVQLLDPDGRTRERLVLPGDDFASGVRAAATDLTGDGVPDLVLASAPGVSGWVLVLDGVTHAVVWEERPFEMNFTGGVFVATGDLTGDGVPDLAVTADRGGGPRVRVFDGRTFASLADFFGIDDPAFRGGARAAIGDLTGDGIGDLVVAAGTGGGPRVAAFDGTSLSDPRRAFGDFFAFEPTLRDGVYVAVGDVDADGQGDLIVGAGPGGGPRLTVFNGSRLADAIRPTLANFFAGDATQRDGVRVAVKDLDGDERADVVVGGTGRVAGYTGKSLVTTGTPTSGFGFNLDLGTIEGVFVG